MPKMPNGKLNDREWLKARISDGLSQLQIAKIADVKLPNVAYYVKKHGLLSGEDRSARTKAAIAERYPNGRRGVESGNWKGGRMSTTGRKPGGYIRLLRPDHPAANKAGYVYEHRVVMEEKIGRLLLPGEVVDHIDRNRSNNAPENLALHASRSAHVKDHFSARDQLVIALRRIGELEEKVAALEVEFGPMGWKRDA